MDARGVTLVASVCALLSCGCATAGLSGWAQEPARVASRVTSVEAWRASPAVIGLHVVDVAEDDVTRRRAFWWGDERDVAQVASWSTMSRGWSGAPALRLVQSLPLLPDATALEVVGPGAPTAAAEVLVLRGERLERWRRGRLVESAPLLADVQTRPPGTLRQLALGLGLPVTITLDLLTSPVQLVVAIVVLAVNARHLFH